MRQIRLGRTGLKVSELCLGTIALGAQPIDPVLDTFLEAGGTFIDTADTYGPAPGIAESSIGNWLSRKGHRDQIVLATKGGGSIGRNTAGRGLNRRHLLSAVEDSLRRLRTDWIDLYQTNFPDPETPEDETMAALDQLVRDGKVRYVGCSNFPAWRIAYAKGISDRLRLTSYVTVQTHYSLLARRNFEQDIADAALTMGVGVLPYRTLGCGILTGRFLGQSIPSERWLSGPNGYDIDQLRAATLVGEIAKIAAHDRKTPAQTALAWLKGKPGITAPVIGASTPEQVSELAAGSGYLLAAEHIAHLNEKSDHLS